MWIIYPKIILACAWLADLSPNCSTSRVHLFDFINISDHSRLINSNLLQRSEISVVEDNEVQSEEDSTSKQAHVQLVNKQLSDFWFHQVLSCSRVAWSQFWTSSKFLSAPETTTNNQEVKRGLYRLQNVNNLPWDYICMCLTCRFLAEFFKFIVLVKLQEYIYSIL